MTTPALPPLDGIRVVDLSRVLAGPFCTALLADAGADVVKIESKNGEDSRHLGPFRDGESIYFDILNRGKRSIALDLKDAADQETLLRLIAGADVVVENFRPGVTTRLGIDYAAARARNPRLVYASISGFGQHGPMSRAAAYDLVVQALSGVMSITGTPDSGPTRLGESFGDTVAGLFAAWGISTALLAARATGRGQHLDVAMFDSMLAMLPTAHSQFQATGATPARVGNRHPVSTPFDTYRADDGLFVLAVAGQKGFETLARTMGRVELIADPRFADDTARTRNEPALRKEIESWAAGRTVAQVLEVLDGAGLAGSEVWSVEQALGSDQARHRGLVESFEHPVAGTVSYVRQPVVFGDSDRPAVRRSPLLDEHHDEILTEIHPR
ncbi:CaiB/BaiF CoA transferase family protein [Nocardia testacea]|uniref:CaiB/BaiF CoA transferase family protein n=1 Tax=Nocardia testacea TaxID=248551 RepID=UPI003C2D2249